MQELFSLIVVIVTFVIWIAQNVSQMKKRSQEEFDEAWQQMKEEEAHSDETRGPSPPQAPRPVEQPASPSAPTWKDLQEQLEQMLGQPPRKQPIPVDEDPPFPAPAPQPAIPRRIPDAVPSPTALHQEPAREARAFRQEPMPAPPKRVQRPARPETRPAPHPAAAAQKTGTDLTTPEPAPSPHKGPASGHHHRGQFPNLHPNPISNAILIAEVLKPYSRRRAFGPRV